MLYAFAQCDSFFMDYPFPSSPLSAWPQLLRVASGKPFVALFAALHILMPWESPYISRLQSIVNCSITNCSRIVSSLAFFISLLGLSKCVEKKNEYACKYHFFLSELVLP